MSYSCEICFKKLEAEDVYDFLQQFKTAVREKLANIAEDNFLWVPYIRHSCNVPENFGDVSRDKRTEAEFWAYRSIFSYRYFYDKEFKLLGMYSVPECVQDLFDGSVYFQNSCDQNYNRKEWQGIAEFEAIYDKWQSCPVKDVEKHYLEKHSRTIQEEYAGEDIDYEQTIAYYRKTFAYKEIWNRYEASLYNEDSIVYLSLFGFYDLVHVTRFLKICHDKYIEWRNRD